MEAMSVMKRFINYQMVCTALAHHSVDASAGLSSHLSVGHKFIGVMELYIFRSPLLVVCILVLQWQNATSHHH